MCEICGYTPCLNRCPNAEEVYPVCTCTQCGSGIYAGDRFWESPDGPICEACLDDMSCETLLAIMGEEMQEAKEEEYERE